LTTAQLPPTFVEPPRLTVLGTRRVYAEWTRPEQLNGDLQRYLLYVSLNPSLDGQVLYNETDQFEHYTIEGLIPGTLYFIRVAVRNLAASFRQCVSWVPCFRRALAAGVG
jgi:hypothetical protein